MGRVKSTISDVKFRTYCGNMKLQQLYITVVISMGLLSMLHGEGKDFFPEVEKYLISCQHPEKCLKADSKTTCQMY